MVVDRGPSPYLSALELSCDGRHMTTVQGDGIIFATPTGSTAYSLAGASSLPLPPLRQYVIRAATFKRPHRYDVLLLIFKYDFMTSCRCPFASSLR